jgi:hypothetical protein
MTQGLWHKGQKLVKRNMKKLLESLLTIQKTRMTEFFHSSHKNQKIETSKSFPSNKDSANEEFQSSFDENSREILKIDEGLHFTFK